MAERKTNIFFILLFIVASVLYGIIDYYYGFVSHIYSYSDVIVMLIVVCRFLFTSPPYFLHGVDLHLQSIVIQIITFIICEMFYK